MTTTPTTSPLGYGLSCTFCSCVLPMPGPGILPTQTVVVAIQPPMGLGTNPTSGATLPSAVSGRSALTEAILRRISTARGTLPDSKAPTTVGNYGIDVGDYVNADMSQSDCGRLAAAIDAQCRQDERVINSVTTATLAGDFLTIVIRLWDGAGPFKLTLAINVLVGNLQILGTT